MRQRPVVVIALSLLLIAGAAGFQLRGQILHLLVVDRPIPGSPPLAFGSTWGCLSGWSNAYRSSMLYYPFNHPAPPPHKTEPTRCFRTDGEARSAGYKVAPPPQGGAVQDGVYLVRSSSRVRTNCEAAAAQLQIAIPCPTLLALELADSFCSPNSICTVGGEFAAQIPLATPPDFPRAQALPNHQFQLELLAAPLSSTLGQQLNECPRGNFGPTVMGRPTLWTTCNRASDESPLWLTWEVDNWIYLVGAAAPTTSAVRRIIQFFASKLVAVSSTGG